MASSSSTAASVALEIRDVGVMRITSVFDDVDELMHDPEPAKKINLATWMADIYQKLGDEVETLGDAIDALRRASQDPRQTAPHLVRAYEQTLRSQHEFCERTEHNIQLARREDFQNFEAASTQFASKMRLSMEFVQMSAEQQIAEKGRQTMQMIEVYAKGNSEQWVKMEGWARGTNDQMATLRQQAALSKSSLDEMARELRRMKEDQFVEAGKAKQLSKSFVEIYKELRDTKKAGLSSDSVKGLRRLLRRQAKQASASEASGDEGAEAPPPPPPPPPPPQVPPPPSGEQGAAPEPPTPEIPKDPNSKKKKGKQA